MSKVLISLCIALACIALPVRAEAFCLKHALMALTSLPLSLGLLVPVGAAVGVEAGVRFSFKATGAIYKLGERRHDKPKEGDTKDD